MMISFVVAAAGAALVLVTGGFGVEGTLGLGDLNAVVGVIDEGRAGAEDEAIAAEAAAASWSAAAVVALLMTSD